MLQREMLECSVRKHAGHLVNNPDAEVLDLPKEILNISAVAGRILSESNAAVENHLGGSVNYIVKLIAKTV